VLTLSETISFSLVFLPDEALLRRNTGSISSKSNEVWLEKQQKMAVER